MFDISEAGSNTITIFALLFGGGGFVAGLAALVMLRPNKDKVVVETAQGVVVMSKVVIDELRMQINELKKEHLACETKYAELLVLFKKIDERQEERRRRELELTGEHPETEKKK